MTHGSPQVSINVAIFSLKCKLKRMVRIIDVNETEILSTQHQAHLHQHTTNKNYSSQNLSANQSSWHTSLRLTVFWPVALRSSCFISENCRLVGSTLSATWHSVSPSALDTETDRSSLPSASRFSLLHAPHVMRFVCLPRMGIFLHTPKLSWISTDFSTMHLVLIPKYVITNPLLTWMCDGCRA